MPLSLVFGGYVPDYVLTNEELSRMVDTTDEWIMERVGIKERRILTEEGLGTSYMARKAAKQLLERQELTRQHRCSYRYNNNSRL